MDPIECGPIPEPEDMPNKPWRVVGPQDPPDPETSRGIEALMSVALGALNQVGDPHKAAAMLLRAWNSHDALVEACQAALVVCPDNGPFSIGGRLRAAIARAKETPCK